MASARSKKVAFSFDRPAHQPAPTHRPATQGPSKIRCFDGLTRRTSDWHGLKRDHQLWFAGGDCLVHFAPSTGSALPSLKLPFKAIEALQSRYLLQSCLQTRGYLDVDPADESTDDSGYASSPSDFDSRTIREIRIPIPPRLSEKDTLRCNLATRNFFAYAVSRPVVGERLSTALLDLWHRIEQWQPGSSAARAAFRTYLQKQGYLNFAENAEHALACLQPAEEARMRDVWIDAFAHCVGMHHRLDLSPEFPVMDKNIMAMITRASLEMDLKMTRTLRAVGGFLEDELGPECLGLSRPARDHLDRFRSFLHAFYVEKIGYFPPHPDARRNRPVWAAIQSDFECLYGYLVDKTSSNDLASNTRLDGGICVLQNVKAFDERHGFDALPHPLPLLPLSAASTCGSTTKRRHSLRRGVSSLLYEHDSRHQPIHTLATNIDDENVMLCELVHKYQLFERHRLEEKLDPVEARKVRWFLVYGALQMLNSVVKAPNGVTNAHDVSYPVCIAMTVLPQWLEEPEDELHDQEFKDIYQAHSLLVPQTQGDEEGRHSRISIHPDCEADCAEDFFASTRSTGSEVSRKISAAGLSRTRTPSKIKTPLSRTNSLRSSVQSLHKSVVGSLTRRSSSRRQSMQSDSAKFSVCRSVQEDEISEPQSADSAACIDEEVWLAANPIVEEPESMQGFDFGLQSANSEPILEHHQLNYPFLAADFRPDSETNMVESDPVLRAAMQQNSSKSVPNLVHEVNASDAGFMVPFQSGSRLYNVPYGSEDCIIPSRGSSMRHTKLSSQHLDHHQSSSTSAYRASMNAGCYVPTGMIRFPDSTQFPSRRGNAWDEEVIDINDALRGQHAIYDPNEHELDEGVRNQHRSRALHFLEQSWTSRSEFVSVM